jgi:hypothetical protein
MKFAGILGIISGERSQIRHRARISFPERLSRKGKRPGARRCGTAIFSKALDEVPSKKRAGAFVKTPPVLGLAESAAGG